MSKAEYTHVEWINEFHRRAGGEDWDHVKNVRFVCPTCKTTYSVEDCYAALGSQELALNDAPQYCIHRLKEDGKCDWVSFGFFCGPVTVMMADGECIHVFDFAEVSDQ